MEIILNHTIVPARDREASARFFADVFGLKYEGASGHFAPVRVNETLTLDFDDDDHFDIHHYAFHVSDPEFDAISSGCKKPESHMAATRGILRISSSIPGTVAGASTSAIPTDTYSS